MYRAPLSTGYSASELMFGKAVKSKLSVNSKENIAYEEFESRKREMKSKLKGSCRIKIVRIRARTGCLHEGVY